MSEPTVEFTNQVIIAGLRAELDERIAENAELRTQLDAWHTSFGTTQLTHAVSEMEQVKSHLEKEEARCASKNAMLQRVFEMRCDDDVDWKDLSAAELLEAMDDRDKGWLRKTLDDAKASKANRLSPDEVDVLRKENAKLRAKLEKALDENNSLKLDYSHAESERVALEAKVKVLGDALDKLLVHSMEFFNDWKKGDFGLPKLAQCDTQSMAEQFPAAQKILREMESK